ncbi:hypothetical protein A2239_02160 [Candidatus Uhrbacteria bacterium RIFOXYA2_FULL_40_9]|nr:MAG: hypothetical protein A2239_02160 [Candidatus Uhrbacteria bacterium RIFOXYA2_FULL_40_9]OGL96997.1 MAG: hypothetical protein A2332_03965 [Candidatus Uhrbacteria bacterium RIFOXYB2_FULL_41_18]
MVIAIVLIVSTLAVIAVNTARSKQRDATRLSNLRQVQSALEDYFNENNIYPSGQDLPLGDVAQSICLDMDGFQANCVASSSIFLQHVTGTYQSGLDGLVLCGEPTRNAFCYTQTNEGLGYNINFELENALSLVGLTKGVNCALPSGMISGQCE